MGGQDAIGVVRHGGLPSWYFGAMLSRKFCGKAPVKSQNSLGKADAGG